MARSKPTKTNTKKTAPKPKAKKTPRPAPKMVSKSAAPSGGLEAIGAALAAGDGGAALVAALDAWRTARAPALAELIDAISKRVSGPPITTDIEWTRIAAARDPRDLGRLLAIRELPVSFLPTMAVRLAAYPDDPRIASAAADWILDPPTTSSSAYPFWTKLFELLGRLGDTRAIAPMAKRVKLPQEPSNVLPKLRQPKPSQFWGKYYKALDKTRAQLEDVEVPAVGDAAIAKLAKQVGKLAVIEGGTKPAGRAKSATTGGPPLARALVHAIGGGVGAAIDALLEAWREKRAPELADLIDRATRMLPSYDLPLPPGKAAHDAWQAAFAADAMGALPQLARHINVGGSSAAVEHVASLATLPDDPRIALRLAELASTHTISPEKGQYWKTCWEIIARARDVRVIPSLRVHFRDFTGTYYDHHKSGRRIVGDFVLGELPPSPLDATDYQAIAEIEKALGKLEAAADRRERELIADIVKHWADEGPRLVYADWLTERGNLRGELIVLDCKLARDGKLSSPEGKQLTAMQTRFRDVTYMFGPLSDVGHVLDRGIPAALAVAYSTSAITWRHLVGYPLLAGIETIDLSRVTDMGRPFAGDLARVMLDATATRLVKVTGVPNDQHGLLASDLEPLVKGTWKRDKRDFIR